MTQVTIGGASRPVERFTLVKALRAMTLLKLIQRLVPEASEVLGTFVSEYRAAHVTTLDRVQAKMEFGGEVPVLDESLSPIVTDDGRPVTLPAPIESLTEKDWEQAGHVLRQPENPPLAAMIAAVFPTVVEGAEQPVLRLLAISIIPNDQFAGHVRAGTWEDEADRVVENDLLEADLDEVLELAVTVGEVLDGQLAAKVEDLGGRVGKLASRFGLGRASRPESDPSPSGDSPTSSPSADGLSADGSTPSPSDTDGAPSRSSDLPSTMPSDSSTDGPESKPTPTESTLAGASSS